jgi:hypothetical protein
MFSSTNAGKSYCSHELVPVPGILRDSCSGEFRQTGIAVELWQILLSIIFYAPQLLTVWALRDNPHTAATGFKI